MNKPKKEKPLKERNVQLTVYVPAEVKTKLLIQSAKTGITLSQIVFDALVAAQKQK